MLLDIDGTRSLLGRCVSAEVRARMAASRTSGKRLAALVGMSQNYLATRLRDEKPFTLDDVEAILTVLGTDGAETYDGFVGEAVRRNSDTVRAELSALELRLRDGAAPAQPADGRPASHSTTVTAADIAAGVGLPRGGPRPRRTKPTSDTTPQTHS